MIPELTQDFIEIIKDYSHDGSVSAEAIAGELYQSEWNFNNADPTSGQQCYQEHEIKEAVIQAFKQQYE